MSERLFLVLKFVRFFIKIQQIFGNYGMLCAMPCRCRAKPLRELLVQYYVIARSGSDVVIFLLKIKTFKIIDFQIYCLYLCLFAEDLPEFT